MRVACIAASPPELLKLGNGPCTSLLPAVCASAASTAEKAASAVSGNTAWSSSKPHNSASTNAHPQCWLQLPFLHQEASQLEPDQTYIATPNTHAHPPGHTSPTRSAAAIRNAASSASSPPAQVPRATLAHLTSELHLCCPLLPGSVQAAACTRVHLQDVAIAHAKPTSHHRQEGTMQVLVRW